MLGGYPTGTTPSHYPLTRLLVGSYLLVIRSSGSDARDQFVAASEGHVPHFIFFLFLQRVVQIWSKKNVYLEH